MVVPRDGAAASSYNEFVTNEERIAAAREKVRVLYDGKLVRHRSCGIALAETFNLPTRPYQSLRRGGITGHGQCGAVKGGEMVLGEVFGDPDPGGPVAPVLREAISYYQAEVTKRMDKGRAKTIICNDLTGQFPEFQSEERLGFCTRLEMVVAETVAETILKFGGTFEVTPLPPS